MRIVCMCSFVDACSPPPPPLPSPLPSSPLQRQLLEEKLRELSDGRDQLEVAREAEEEYERRLDEEQAKGRRKVHALEVKSRPRAWGLVANILTCALFLEIKNRLTAEGGSEIGTGFRLGVLLIVTPRKQ